MRFDSLSNLWLMDNEGRVTCWTTPLSNSESKKPKEVMWQESELPMIPCKKCLNLVLGKMLRTDLLKDTLAWKSNNQSVKIYQKTEQGQSIQEVDQFPAIVDSSSRVF